MKRFKNNISPDNNIIYKQKASPRAERERPFLYEDVSAVATCITASPAL